MRTHERGSLASQVHSAHAGPFVLSETKHGAGFRAPAHAHARATLNVVLSGGYSERAGGSFHVHPPMTLVAKPPGETHANEFRDVGARCLLLEVAAPDLEQHPEIGGLFAAPHILPGGGAAAAVTRLLREMRGAVDDLSPLALEAAAIDLIVDAGCGLRQSEPANRPPDWVRRIEQRLRDDPSGRISLGELADLVDREPSYVSREFRRAMGRTLSRFAREMRFERACRLMANGETPLGMVALQAGYCDQAHCANAFRATLGMTATQFRHLLRGSDGRTNQRIDEPRMGGR